MANELTNAFKQISKAIEKASIDVLNNAAISGRTRFASDIRESTGLPQSRVGSRMITFKATLNDQRASVQIANGVALNAKYFKPQAITVAGNDKRTGKTRNYTGVTIKIGNQARYVLPNAWLATVSNGEVIPLVRKGAARLPTRAVFLDVITDAAKAARPAAQEVMRDSFEALLPVQLQFFLSQANNIDVV